MKEKDTVTFTVNGETYKVGPEHPVGTSLATYLRSQGLTGLQISCREGGCGSCAVVVEVADPHTGDNKAYSVNACQTELHGCQGWAVTTVEGLGNTRDGLHPIQEHLVKNSGTQCGFCSPGMVMAMYGITQSKPSWTAEDVEHNMDGNLCRCTGYRPILDAFKSVTPLDIEEAHKSKCCAKGNGECSGKTKGSCDSSPSSSASSKSICCRSKTKDGKAKAELPSSPSTFTSSVTDVNGVQWYQPTSMQELYTLMGHIPQTTSYRFVAGNTGNGIYDDGPYKVWINTTRIPDLYRVYSSGGSLIFGANVSLTRLIEVMKENAAKNPGFAYLRDIAKHFQHVGNMHVRNSSSWGGNLAMRALHDDFSSDLAICFEAANATVTTASVRDMTPRSYTIKELLNLNLREDRLFILELYLHEKPFSTVYRSFKITRRAVNAHAYVNAAFRMSVDRADAHTVKGKPSFCFGGIRPGFMHAEKLETYLTDKSLEDEATVQGAMAVLEEELQPVANVVDASPEYRKQVAQALVYKTILGTVSQNVPQEMESGATDLERPLSHGTQTYDLNQDSWPFAEPVPKLESGIQCTGEAEYVDDMPELPGELHAAFVLSKQANATLDIVDPSQAVALEGVVAYFGADDIPGTNSIIAMNDFFPEETFASSKVVYYDQPIGIVVAKTWEIAQEGASKVRVTYKDVKKPVLTIQEALKTAPEQQPPPYIVGDVDAALASAPHVITGTNFRDGQAHFHIETHTSRAVPTDEGMSVFSSTQDPAETQRAVAQVLGMSDNDVTLMAKRLGGAFGGKINRGNYLATAAALAAHHLQKPVRMTIDLHTNLRMMGGREPHSIEYKVATDDNGKLLAVRAHVIADAGCSLNGTSVDIAILALPSCYSCPNWDLKITDVLTNTPSNTWCRTPAYVEGVCFMEEIIERVAAELDLDPLDVRRTNLLPDGSSLPSVKSIFGWVGCRGRPASKKILSKNLIHSMLDKLETNAEVAARKQYVEQFNKNNRWKKRGISVMPSLYVYEPPPLYPFNSMVSIYASDGSIVISHGGVEMGQGINTKVAQAAAYALRAPLDMVKIRSYNSVSNANTSMTAGSHGSNMAPYCIEVACKKLRKRLDEVRKSMNIPGEKEDWVALIKEAWSQGVDLSDRYWNTIGELENQLVFCVGCTEVELDVLTGQWIALRTDMIEDTGRTMNPLVDIGQIEGAFVMGIGLHTSEQVISHPETGERLSHSTWHYKPPTALDIPVDFRVDLIKNTKEIGVTSSKITGEPPLLLSYTVPMALRQAVTSARKDAGTTGWFTMDMPATVEKLQQLCLNDTRQFLVKKAPLT
ncbi:uncharacterized protein LOC143029787 [Oratosquilla oratoria]|uniref:uncharacterized protein LOC143029787 n=1 Tax=Oratosquilla oratoria TaxID=337810 RepID=UPI003F75FBF3